jgi:hypothetical protein
MTIMDGQRSQGKGSIGKDGCGTRIQTKRAGFLVRFGGYGGLVFGAGFITTVDGGSIVDDNHVWTTTSLSHIVSYLKTHWIRVIG